MYQAGYALTALTMGDIEPGATGSSLPAHKLISAPPYNPARPRSERFCLRRAAAWGRSAVAAIDRRVQDWKGRIRQQANAAECVAPDGRIFGASQGGLEYPAPSLTWRWLKAGSTVGKATALTIRMIVITTRSSISVNPGRAVVFSRVDQSHAFHHPEPPIAPPDCRLWLLISSCAFCCRS